MKSLLSAGAAIALIATAGIDVTDATARPACLTRDEILYRLKSEFAEEVVGAGLQVNGSLLEVTASPNGTFTVIVTTPVGKTLCAGALTAGKGWGAIVPLSGRPA